jgi:hypothetical protein
MSLQKELEDFMSGVKKQVPPEVLTAIEKSMKEVTGSVQNNEVLKVGNQAPLFALPNALGKITKLSDLLKDGPVFPF